MLCYHDAFLLPKIQRNWLEMLRSASSTKPCFIKPALPILIPDAGPAILRPPSSARAEWADKFAAISIEKPALKGLRRADKSAVAEAGDQGQHLDAKRMLRHDTI